MKRIRQWVDRLSVKKKLVFYGYLTITPVLVLICVAMVINNYKKECAKRLENDLTSVNTLSESFGILQTDIKDFSTYICINNDIHDLLVTDEVEEKNANAKLWLEEAPMEIVQDMMALKGYIKTIAIYPSNGIRPYLRCMDGSAYVSDLDSIYASQSYQATIASESGMVWKWVPKGKGETYETNRTDKIVLYRRIPDLRQKTTLGYIAIGVGQEYFLKLCEGIVKNDTEGVLVLDQQGGVLVKTGTLDEEVEAYLESEAFIGQNYRTREEHITYGDYEIISRQLDKNSSIVCKVVPGYRLQTQVYDIVYMPCMLLLGMLIGLMPLLLIISNIVTNPLHKLTLAINEVSNGDLEQQVEVVTHDEVGEVAECFNRMVLALKELIEENYVITLQEKESELAALQAQINPHFLYNTLDSLYWQATNEGNDEIAESILALSQLFRLVLSQGSREVTVAQETELIYRYLQIQKMRFTKRLNFTIQVDEDIKQAKMPKLILQPFVENAIVHGFENVSTPCDVIVTGRREEDQICFEIADTGIGMSKEQMDEIWQEEPENYRKQRIGRYAIKNIRERLQRRYGDRFSLEIQSDVGKGTRVTLRIPYEENV